MICLIAIPCLLTFIIYISLQMTHSTEQLSAEMANIDCIMQDLNAIKDGFEMA